MEVCNMAPAAPTPNDFNWRDALYSYAHRGQSHPRQNAVKTGFFYMINGQEVFEFVAAGPVVWIEPRGEWGIVREKDRGFRWFE